MPEIKTPVPPNAGNESFVEMLNFISWAVSL